MFKLTVELEESIVWPSNIQFMVTTVFSRIVAVKGVQALVPKTGKCVTLNCRWILYIC